MPHVQTYRPGRASWAFALCVAALSGPAGLAGACSIFMAAQDGQVLAGNNEDFYLDVEPKLWVTPGEGKDHGRACWGFAESKRAQPFAQGGMNDKGLFFDAAVTPPAGPPKKERKPKAPRNMGDRMLAECGTVAEALDWLGRYDLHLLEGGHLLLADAAGDGAVAELHEGALNIFRRKTKHYVAATNFSFADPARGNYPCPRFAKIDRYFGEEHGAVTMEGFRHLLAAVAQPRTFMEKEKRHGGTLYSNVCDLKRGTITFFRAGDFATPIRLDLATLLRGGARTIQMRDLVPSN